MKSPQNVKLVLNTTENKIILNWEKVACAIGYEIKQNHLNSELGVANWTYFTEKTRLEVEVFEPCMKLRYN